jgi:hypothetical protein
VLDIGYSFLSRIEPMLSVSFSEAIRVGHPSVTMIV